jgi:predicted RNA binding protein YcfA (HicA-like mRNA interferase family)
LSFIYRICFSTPEGSHKIYKNKEGVRITVPYHTGKTIHPKILKNILRDSDLTIEEFRELMK